MYGRASNRHASVYGTEQDPHNCSFFLRIGACRNGECCPKKHNWPSFSNTLLLEHVWVCPKKVHSKKRKRKAHYDRFVEDLLEEMSKHGEVQDMFTMENLGDHMLGNTFVVFEDEDQAAKAKVAIAGRFYAGRQVTAKFSPISDFDNARCRDFVSGVCKRGHFCNFAHFLDIPRWARKYMDSRQSKRKYKGRKAVKEEASKKEFPINGNREQRMACIAKWNEERAAKIRKEGGDPTYPYEKEVVGPESALNLYRPN